MGARRPCVICYRSLNRVTTRRRRQRVYCLTLDFMQANPFLMNYLVEEFNIREVNDGDALCRPCFQRAQRYFQRADEVVDRGSSDDDNQVEPEQNQVNENEVGEAAREPRLRYSMPVPGYSRAPNNSQVCLFNCDNNQGLQRVCKQVRTMILRDKNFYIPRRARVCEEHLLDAAWLDVEYNTRHIYREFTPENVSDMLNILKNNEVFLDFEALESISDGVFHFYIGFSKAQFQEILAGTPNMNQFKNPATALATVLVKLHTGESDERLSSLFQMSRRSYERTMKAVRNKLINQFVPMLLGYNHITREEIALRCLAIPKYLFGNDGIPERNLITIFDGTYIYLQKSSNYHFQRKSYSLHKYRNLYKPFMMVCPDGHIIDIYGPYDAATSDAHIMNHILDDHNDPFHWVYKEGDVFILDRGFRDSLENMESFGYYPKVPVTKTHNHVQLTTQQANESRKVTLCRWVVETINGRLKNQFKQLRHTTNNRAMRHLFQEIKIAGALLNAFGKPLTDHRLVNEIINQIGQRSLLENHLSRYITENNINARRAAFESITSENPTLNSFPVLNEDELIIFALGTYQLKQARSYYGEHINNDGSYMIEVYRDLNVQHLDRFDIITEHPWLLRGRIQSRHRQNKVYYVYILIEGAREGRNAIIGHYCSCIVGNRTLGCCSHVMSITWYLGWGRHQENLSPPAQFLDSIIIRHDIKNEAHNED